MDVLPIDLMTTVIICQNVPLDNTYTDTLTFVNEAAQEAYFKSKGVITLTNMSPIRMQNAIRIPRNAQVIYSCNYLMFQNANFGSKWFYCFINDIQFQNVNMATVTFELDVMQTWKFDYTVKPSFVLREHTNDDTIGANLVDENLEYGDYVFKDLLPTTWLNENYKIVIATTFNKSVEPAYGTMYSGIYSGLEYNVFDITEAAEATGMLIKLDAAGKSSAVVSVFMMPGNFVSFAGSTEPKTMFVVKKPNYSDLDGYVPHNNKMFTHPYNFLYVTNNEGTEANFKYELFKLNDQGQMIFNLYGDMSCNPEIIMAPENYAGVEGSNFNEKIAINGFPQCAWTSDAFKAWLAQNASSMGMGILSSAFAIALGIGATGAGGATGNPVMIAGGIMGIQNTLAKIKDKSVMPPQAHGQSTSNISFATKTKDFYLGHVTIRREFAQRIDQYFDMFGYATNKLKVPNVTGRPSWNYVKTMEAKIVGNVPFNDMAKIKDNFNKGITFWHGDWVGDYTRNNKLGGAK